VTFLELWDPLHISGTVDGRMQNQVKGGRNFFGKCQPLHTKFGARWTPVTEAENYLYGSVMLQ